MSAASVADLVDQLRKGRLLDAARLDKVVKAQDRFPDAVTLARELVKRGWLTREQAQSLLKGQPAPAPAERPAAVAPPPRRRRAAWLLVVLALLLLGGAASVGCWWHFSEPNSDNRAGAGSSERDLPPPVEGCSDTSDLKVLDDLVFGPSVRAPFDPKTLDALKDKPIPEVEVYPWQPPGLVAVLGEHRMRGAVIAASPDGKQIAVGGQDGFIRVGPIETMHEKAVLGGHVGVHALAWSPKGDFLAAAQGGGVVRLWDVRDLDKVPEAVVLEKADDVRCLAYSSDGMFLLGGGPEADGRGVLLLWDVGDPAARRQVYRKLRSKPMLCVAFSPAPGDYRALWGGPEGDGALHLIDAKSGDDLAVADCRYGGKDDDERKKDAATRVVSIAFSPDGKRAASGHFDYNPALAQKGDWLVRVWDLDRFEVGKERRVLKGLFVNSAPLVAFAPDNKTVAVGRTSDTGSVCLADADSGAAPRPLAQTSSLSALTFLPRGDRTDDRVVFAGSLLADWNVHVHEAATGKELAAPVGHLGAVQAVAGSPDGANVVSGGYEGRAWLWDLSKVAPRHSATPGGQVWDVGFHPDGKQAFYCGNATAHVPFLDVDTGKTWAPPYNKSHNGGITNAVISEDGHYVLSGGAGDGSVRLWSLIKEGRHYGEQVRHFGSPAAESARVALSPDGKRALRATDRSLKLLHLRCLEVRHEWAAGTWNTFLPDDGGRRRLAILGGPAGGALWDVSDDEAKEAGALKLPLTGARPGDFSRDGRRLATVLPPRATVWDRTGGDKPLWGWAPPSHFGGVRAVALAPDGRYLFTANGDGTVYVIQLP